MITRQEQFFRDIVAALDIVALIAAFFLSYLIRDLVLGPWFLAMPPLSSQVWLLGIMVPIWFIVLRRASLRHSATIGSHSGLLSTFLWAQLTAGVVLFGALHVLRSYEVSRLFLAVYVLVSGVLLFTERMLIRRLFASRRDWHGLGCRRLAIVPNDSSATERLLKLLAQSPLKNEIVGFLRLDDGQPAAENGRRYLGSVDNAEDIFREHVVDEVIAAASSPALTGLALECLRRGITFRTFLDLPPALAARAFIDTLDSQSFLLSLETVAQEPRTLFLKRVLDVIGAVVGLVAVGFVHVWYLRRLRRESPGPVYFRQVRMGQNGRSFVAFKFRTMYPDAEQRLASLRVQNEMQGAFFKMRDDPRLLPSGKALRRRYLDELPQFWNVLKGEMSLVGTRPPTAEEVLRYRPHHYRRLSMKPGITGLWQLEGNGRVNDFEQVVRLDCRYINDWSLWLDCKILWKTLAKVVRAEGW